MHRKSPNAGLTAHTDGVGDPVGMKKPVHLLLVLLLGCSIRLGFAADANEQAERKKLTGVWRGFTVEGKGEHPDRGPVKLELTITERTIKGLQFKGAEVIDHGEGTYELGLTNTPPTLDGTKPRGRNNKDVWLGVYSLEGDTLKWCVRKQSRPSEFETKDKAFLLILRRTETKPAPK
jgi:uncharacterized protein (TIGR03067 family)